MSEQRLENNLIKELIKLGYEEVDVKNEAEMYDNLFECLNKLNNNVVTEKMFEEIKLKISTTHGEINKAIMLRQMNTYKSEIDGIDKEIQFIDSKNWSNNTFQVTNQVVMEGKHRNRYDVTILINGLPLVHIELKKNTVDYAQAFGQLKRYKRDTMPATLFDFTQLFVISNENTTKYIANNKGEKLDDQFAFEWKDEENYAYTNLFDFTKNFLKPSKISKFISNYMLVANELKDGNAIPDKLMAMRSYQVHAVEKILAKVKDQTGDGYIWHTTGSGKTLTSFKACELISKQEHIDKVLFLVDRTSLDEQTNDEYKKFRSVSDTSLNKINLINRTSVLVDKLNSDVDPILITTIQKLNKAVTDPEFSQKLRRDRKVVLIFDECHRSQFGDMHKNIDTFFNKPQKFGFTGTPILQFNAKADGKEYATTADVFGEQLHKYLINDAIEDRNVLGFNIDYKSIIKDESVDNGEEVEDIDRREALNHINYLKQIAEDVLNTYDRFTHKKSYNAMLATSGINNATRLYKLLKGHEVEGVQLYVPSDFKVACVYSYSDNKDDLNNNRIDMETIIEEYNQTYEEANYTLGDFDKYKTNVSERVKNREVDLLIVSDMFLTGFDAQKLNTLYLDKDIKYHTLIQAISRTNRICDKDKKKSFGNVICYRPSLKNSIDEALREFSNKDAEQNYIKPNYTDQLKCTNDVIDILLNVFPIVPTSNELKGDEAKLDFIQSMRQVNRELNKLLSYRDFDYKELNMSENKLGQYNATLVDIKRQIEFKSQRNKDSILNDIAFEVELIETNKIDYDYITVLLREVDKVQTVDAYDKKVQQILTKLENDASLQNKYGLIQAFFDDYYNRDNFHSITLDEAVERHNAEVEEKELLNFANENKVEPDFIVSLYEKYSVTKNFEYCASMIRARDEETIKGSEYKKIKKRKHHDIQSLFTNIKEKIITFI